MTDLSHSDVDLIRRRDPRQDHRALAALALIAAGSFVWGLGRQVIGPLDFAPAAAEPASVAIPHAQPLPPDVQPTMQVAATARPAPPPAPKLDVPDPAPVASAAATPVQAAEPAAAAPALEPPPTADAGAAVTAPAAPPVDTPPPEEPPSD